MRSEPSPPITARRRFLDVVGLVRSGMAAHQLGIAAAGVALLAFTSIVPTMIAAVSIYGLVADPEDISEQITDLASSIDGDDEGGIASLLEDAIPSDSGSEAGIAATLGIALAIFSASAAISNLLAMINSVFEEPETRSFPKRRFMAIVALVGGLVFMGAASFMLTAVTPILERSDLVSWAADLIEIASFPLLGIVLAAGLSALYHWGPNRDMGGYVVFRPGAVVATLLWLLISIALSAYFSSDVFAANASFAVFGSIIALLLWLSLSARSVLIGAEVEAALMDCADVGHPTSPEDSPRVAVALLAGAKAARKSGDEPPRAVILDEAALVAARSGLADGGPSPTHAPTPADRAITLIENGIERLAERRRSGR